ncbi:MAG TPA: molecular chaperone TorD family protein [Candidatus Dormibacteraeota bacterium]|nr:molecular chaperone TorD family protein [Candidatus Dormibacteraeota bacterium]
MLTIVPDEKPITSIDWQQNDLYRFFALVFAPPTQESFGLLSQPALPEALRNLWQHLECEGEYPGFQWFASYEQYESTYIALFDVGIPEPPVPLFESAHDKSHPAQEIALENTYFYEVLGLKSDPGRAVPDYLVTQLEFLAALRYTGEHTSEESTAVSLARAETEFLERHLLNWLPAGKAKLDGTSAPGFPVLMTMLVQFLRHMHERAEAPPRAEDSERRSML